MVIARNPNSGSNSHANVDALIRKGKTQENVFLGTSIEEIRETTRKERKARSAETGVDPVILRIPTNLLEKIDGVVQARPIRTPRHTWLLEAIHEKLERERGT
jgi:hypothetical protein